MNHIKVDKMKQVLSYAQATLQLPVGHRLVLLDFIPVEERLPEVEFEVYMAILSTLEAPREVCWHNARWQDFRDGKWVDVRHVTHYAEIPEIIR